MIRKLQILILAFMIWIMMYPNPFAQDTTIIKDTTNLYLSVTGWGVFPVDKLSSGYDFDFGGAITGDIKIGSRSTFRVDYAQFEMNGESTNEDIRATFWAAGFCYWLINLDECPNNNFYLIFEGSYNDINQGDIDEGNHFGSVLGAGALFNLNNRKVFLRTSAAFRKSGGDIDGIYAELGLAFAPF